MALFSVWPTLQEHFQLTSEVNVESVGFKLVSKVSVGLCLLATILISIDTLVGTEIECVKGNSEGDKAPENAVNQYCWIHGTKYITEETWDKMAEKQGLNVSGYNPFCNIHSVGHKKLIDLNFDTTITRLWSIICRMTKP